MKTQHILPRLVTACIAFLFLISCSSVLAQDGRSDEQAIRDIIAQANKDSVPVTAMHTTDSLIFVSGAFPRPLIGKQRTPEEQKISESMRAERINAKYKSRIERIVVSQCGDMAYEFGYADMEWDTPDKQHTAFEASYVRVWRKLNGEWKVEVSFHRPNK